MSKNYSSRVINGSWGELIIDGELIDEVTKFEATITLEFTDVAMCGTLAKGKKITGMTCEGSLTLNKLSSYFIKKLNDNMKAGKTTKCKIIASISDPDADGDERIIIKDAEFSKLILANWGSQTLGEESYDFTFTDWELVDII